MALTTARAVQAPASLSTRKRSSSLAHRLLDLRDDRAADVLVERSLAEDRWAAGDPRRGGDAGDLGEQLGGGGATAHDDDVLPAELLGRAVVDGVQLPATEGLLAGVGGMLGFQVLVNLGVALGVMPVTGLTLPFFSAGGSSLFATMTATGLLLNVARTLR